MFQMDPLPSRILASGNGASDCSAYGPNDKIRPVDLSKLAAPSIHGILYADLKLRSTCYDALGILVDVAPSNFVLKVPFLTSKELLPVQVKVLSIYPLMPP
jgi:hypothetical protein